MYSEVSPSALQVPRTLHYGFSHSIESEYWVNTCPYCQAIQGDFYMYMEPDGPFFSLRCGENSPQAFENDLLQLAEYAEQIGNL
jgi:hypothetical protein